MSGLKNQLKKIWQSTYRLYGVRGKVTLGEDVHLGIGTIAWAPNQLAIGNHVYIGKYCTIECDGRIGDNVMLANQVGLIGRWDHDYTVVGKPIRLAPWIGDADYAGEGKGKQIVVEDDVWIGYGAIVLSGVVIGRGAIVASGSVVTKDVPPYSIVRGTPAQVSGSRFTKEEIQKHEEILYGRQITITD